MIPVPALKMETLSPGMDAQFEEMFAIYQAALPQSERKSEAVLHTMLERADYEFRIAQLNGVVVAFSIVISLCHAPARLLEYMAVAEIQRGRGIGAQLLRSATTVPGEESKYLLMEIESEDPNAPDANDRIRRRRFYRRLGCREVKGLAYRMPPVSAAIPPAMSLFVYRESMPPAIDRTQLQLWLECLYTDVYGRPRHDFHIGEMLSSLPPKIELF